MTKERENGMREEMTEGEQERGREEGISGRLLAFQIKAISPSEASSAR